MANLNRFKAKNGVDGNSLTITNVADPVNAQDAATKNFCSNISNITSGTLSVARGGTGAATLTGVVKGNGTSALTAMTGTTNYVAKWTDANTIGAGIIYDNGTNIGIGSAAPGRKLDVEGDGRFVQVQAATTGAITLRQNVGDTVGAHIQWVNNANTVERGWLVVDTSSNMIFATQSSERMRINSAGNVGIGTNTVNYPLEVYGSGAFLAGLTRATTSTDAGAILTFSTLNASSTRTSMADIGGASIITTAGSESGYLFFRTRSAGTMAERGRFDQGGNFLVGKTSTDINTPGFALNAGGSFQGSNLTGNLASTNELFNFNNANTGNVPYDITFRQQATPVGYIRAGSTTTAYNTTSDYRLKENVTPMTGALEKVAALKPVTYTWKANGSFGQGFIAHELQEVVPDAVTGEKDAVDSEGNPKYQGVDTSFLVATLTAAIQELKAELDSAKTRIAELEAKQNT